MSFSEIPQAINLAIEVEQLLQNKESLYQLIKHQNQFEKNPLWVQFIYWLFNINNVAHDAYVLAAYKVNQQSILEATNTMEKDTFLYWLFTLGGVSYGVKKLSSMELGRLLGYQSIESNDNEPKEDETSPVIQKINTNFVKVTNSMLVSLEVLGIQKKIGEELSILDIKTASKTMYLKTHPDKGGDKESFCAVKEAVERINQLITTTNNFDGHEFWQDFERELKDYLTSLDARGAEQEQLKKEFAELHDEFAELHDEFAQRRIETAEISKKHDVMREEINQFQKECESTENSFASRVEACESQMKAMESIISSLTPELLSSSRFAAVASYSSGLQSQIGIFGSSTTDLNTSSVQTETMLENARISAAKQ